MLCEDYNKKDDLIFSDFSQAYDYVFLAQTDTTIGFLSKNPLAINQKKGAKSTKPLLLEVSLLKNIPTRVPVSLRNTVRRAKKTSFVLPNGVSFRVVHDSLHEKFLKGFGTLFSSSANPTGKDFSFSFAYKNADVVIYDKRGLFAAKSSRILKIHHNVVKKMR